MASPTIALRFRDATLEIDTIAAHQAIIEKAGAAWWGWWKKLFEDDHLQRLAKVQYPTDVFIVDRSTKRMFTASVSNWHHGKLSEDDLKLVPDYYRGENGVFGWFKVEKIATSSYDDAIANMFGDRTLIIVGEDDPLKSDSGYEGKLLNKSCVLHLSDVHFGPDYDFLLQGTIAAIGETRKTLTECILSDLERIEVHEDIAAIIVTGDFITAGNWEDKIRHDALKEFAALRTALGLEKEQVIAVPGNHDIVRYPRDSGLDPAALSVENQSTYKHEREFRTFVDELVGRSWRDPLNYVQRLRLKNVDLLFCVLNSCTILATEWTEYGYVGDSGLDALNKLGKQRIDRPSYKIMALHHHLLPVTGVAAPNSKGVTLSLDAPALLDAAQNAGIQIALHGHEHMPRLAKYESVPLMGQGAHEPLLVVSNGSTGVAAGRRPGNERNTYCVFRFSDVGAHLWMRELRPDCKVGSALFDGDLEFSAFKQTR
jgi:predicted phosphodiesterase